GHIRVDRLVAEYADPRLVGQDARQERGDAGDGSEDPVGGAHLVGAPRVVAMPDQRLEYPIPDAGQLLVELVLQVGELDRVAPPGEDAVQHGPLVRLQIAGLSLLPAQREVLARPEP